MDRNEVIGRIGISPGLPDLTITICKPYRKQGYGAMAFSLAVQYCFEALHLEEIYAGCYEANAASLRMIERCGFLPHPEGNIMEKHIYTGENRLQYDFIATNPAQAGKL
jgi:RimJ/RimL family protein N-acetyltransferase